MKKVMIGVGMVVVLTIFTLFFSHNASAPSSQDSPTETLKTIENTGFNKQLYPLNESDSIWWIVSKVSPLSPLSYAPSDLTTPNVTLRIGRGDGEMRLRKETASSLEQMFSSARKSGVNLMLVSGYRSYQLQVSVYNGYVQKYGQAGADKQSARPGTSEHQTGLSADIGSTTRKCELETCFADMTEGKWLFSNAYLYGFIIRYPEGKEKVTGYQFEPWHLRYVGIDLATEMHKQNSKTLEEFFGVVPNSQPY